MPITDGFNLRLKGVEPLSFGTEIRRSIQLSYKRIDQNINSMIQQQTILKIYDNSGAKNVKCIKVLGGYKKKTAKLGDSIVVSIKDLRNKSKNESKVKKGEVHRAVVLKTKTKRTNKDGSILFFDSNSACLINKQNKPIGSRILGPVPKQFKKGKYSKLASISLGTA